MTCKTKYAQLVADTITYLQKIKEPIYITSQDNHFWSQNLPKMLSTPISKSVPPPKSRRESKEQKPLSTPLEPTKNSSPTPKPQPTSTTEKSPPPAPLQKKSSFRSTTPHNSTDNFDTMGKDFQRILPDISFHSSIPSDDKAKQVALSWKYKTEAEPITLLSYKENEKILQFLTQIKRALSHYYLPTKIVNILHLEKENRWELFLSAKNLKLLIASDYSIWQLPHLMKFFHQDPQKRNFLKDTPLILLPDLTMYLQEPLLKATLWHTLNQTINSLNIL